jgi:hypothetical protein
MAKNKPTDTATTVILDTPAGTIEVPRSATVCVVKMASIAGEDGESLPHEYGSTIFDRDYKHVPLDLEAGATAVDAGHVYDHIEAKSPWLVEALASGEVRIYESIAVAFASLPVVELRKVIAVTRHGSVLRSWVRIEEDGEARRHILADLRERLRLWSDHKPLTHLPASQIVSKRPPAEIRA